MPDGTSAIARPWPFCSAGSDRGAPFHFSCDLLVGQLAGARGFLGIALQSAGQTIERDPPDGTDRVLLGVPPCLRLTRGDALALGRVGACPAAGALTGRISAETALLPASRWQVEDLRGRRIGEQPIGVGATSSPSRRLAGVSAERRRRRAEPRTDARPAGWRRHLPATLRSALEASDDQQKTTPGTPMGGHNRLFDDKRRIRILDVISDIQRRRSESGLWHDSTACLGPSAPTVQQRGSSRTFPLSGVPSCARTAAVASCGMRRGHEHHLIIFPSTSARGSGRGRGGHR